MLTFLHISDLHFGAGSSGAGFFDRGRAVQGILDDVEVMRRSLRKPDWIILSGDIAWRGTEYQHGGEADRWLQGLLGCLEVGPERVLMVPGNHDVDRSRVVRSALRIHQGLREEVKKDKTGGLDEYLIDTPDAQSDFQNIFWPKLEAYAAFAQRFPSSTLTPARPFWVKPLVGGSAPIFAVGLNSSLLSFDESDGPESLVLGRGQLFRVFQEIPSNALVVVVIHHPLEGLRDGKNGPHSLLSFVGKRPCVVFCGHVHEQSVVHLPLGTSGIALVAGAGYGHEPGGHRYAWVQLGGEGVNIFPRAWVPARGAFRADTMTFDLDAEGRLTVPLAGLKQWTTQEGWTSRGLDIQAQDRLLLINYQGAFPAPTGYRDWQSLGTADVQGVVEANPALSERLRASLLDADAWDTVAAQVGLAVERACQGLAGALHVFVAAPHAVGGLVGSLLEQHGRFIRVCVYQFQVTQRRWQIFGDDAGLGGGTDYFGPLQRSGEQVGSGHQGAVLALEVIQPMTDGQLEAARARVNAQAVYRLGPVGERLIQPGQEHRAVEQAYEALETLRQQVPGQPIYLATSGPLALVIRLASRLRRTVYSSVVMMHFDARNNPPFYYPVLDLISGKPWIEWKPLVYLKELVLKNVRRFSDVTLPLVAPGMNVLAGPNGAGKSTLLQCIALSMMEERTIGNLDLDYPVSSLVNIKENAARLESTLASDNNGEGGQGTSSPGKDHERKQIMTLRCDSGLETIAASTERDRSWDSSLRRQVHFIGYGPVRRIGTRDSSLERDEALKRAPERLRYLSLFRPFVTQDEARQWWIETFLKPGSEAELKRGLCEQLLNFLNDGLLPDGWGALTNKLELTPDGTSLTLFQASDGVRAVLALVLDMIRQLYQDNPDTFRVEQEQPDPQPRSAEAWATGEARWVIPLPMIVLIDELELHLHPSWQRQVGFWLVKHFPKVQFIVTTHSAFIAQAASHGGLIRLPVRQEDKPLEVLRDHNHWAVVNGTADDAAMRLFELKRVHSERSEALQEQVARLEVELRRTQPDAQHLQALSDEISKVKEQLPSHQAQALELLLRRIRLEEDV